MKPNSYSISPTRFPNGIGRLIVFVSAVFATDHSLYAQDATDSVSNDTTAYELEALEVHSVRGSLVGAQELKRVATPFVDAVVAEDIGKFPDNTVAEALQRVPGVQVERAQGEVSTVVIRGLPDVATTLNGHEIFTGTARGVALQDIPAEMLKSVVVYKSRTPEQIAGGIAGLIDIRLRRPFDFEDFEAGISARGIYGENREKTSWTGSGMVSDRWELDNGAELGVLVAASHQKNYWLDHTIFNFEWRERYPGGEPTGHEALFPDLAGIVTPSTVGSIVAPGERTRPAYSASIQYRNNDGFEAYADILYMGYRNDWQNYFFIGIPNAGTIQSAELAGTYTSPEGGEFGVVKSVVMNNNFTLTSTQAYQDRTDGYQTVGGLKWTRDQFIVTTELVYNWSKIENKVLIVDTQFIAPELTVDFTSGGTPNLNITGLDVANGEDFRFWGLFDNRNEDSSQSLSWKGDLEYLTRGGFFSSIKGGVRVSKRNAEAEASSRNDIPPAAGRGVQLLSTVPGFGATSPDGIFGSGTFALTNWYGPDADFLYNNPDEVRTIFGLPAGPPPYNPTLAFDDTEETYAGYVQAHYMTEVGGKTLDGLFGVRVVQTEQSVKGFDSSGTPINDESDSLEVMPTLNARLELTGELQFRFSAGRTITRPDFEDLNPVVTLIPPTTTGGTFGTGTGGNPELEAVTSDNVDLSLEYYYARSSYFAATGFYRSIDGYVEIVSEVETHDGEDYAVSRPRNSGSGELQGVELTWQHFFDNLTGIFQGFGVQANYTYISGETEDPVTGEKRDLTQVSEHNYNIIGIYERGPFSARLAYNWRGDYVFSFNEVDGPGGPSGVLTVKARDSLDFAASYAIGEQLTITFDVTNILEGDYQDYFDNATLYPRDTRAYDRTIALGARYRF